MTETDVPEAVADTAAGAASEVALATAMPVPVAVRKPAADATTPPTAIRSERATTDHDRRNLDFGLATRRPFGTATGSAVGFGSAVLRVADGCGMLVGEVFAAENAAARGSEVTATPALGFAATAFGFAATATARAGATGLAATILGFAGTDLDGAFGFAAAPVLAGAFGFAAAPDLAGASDFRAGRLAAGRRFAADLDFAGVRDLPVDPRADTDARRGALLPVVSESPSSVFSVRSSDCGFTCCTFAGSALWRA